MNGTTIRTGIRAPVMVWAFKTALIAALTPYAVVAVLLTMISLFGTTMKDVRSSVVEIAAFDHDTWRGAATAWHMFTAMCYVAVIGIRLHTLPPLQALSERFCEALARRWQASVVDRIPGRYKTFVDPHYAFVAMFLLIAGVVALSNVWMKPVETPRPALPASAPKIEQYASAAIALPDGSIASGKATVTQESDRRYIVTFATKSKER